MHFKGAGAAAAWEQEHEEEKEEEEEERSVGSRFLTLQLYLGPYELLNF